MSRRRIDPNCVACGGKGLNSHQRLCAPCQLNGEPVPPAPPVEAAQNADGSIDVEGKPHYQCVACEEWFARGGLIKDDRKPGPDGQLRCGNCYRRRFWRLGKPVEPFKQVDPALEGFL